MKKFYALALILLMGCGGESDPEEEKLNYTITVSAGEGGSVDTLGGTYPEGTALTITATPDAEYLFDGWSGTEISTSNPLNVILTGNESVVANFVKKQYDLALSIEGEGTVEEVVTQAGKEYASGTEVELTALPAEGWMFNGWTGDLETIDNPVNITIDEAKSVTANFIRKTYELTVNIEGKGTVDEQVVVAPSQYEFETQVDLTANPTEGWEFSNWSGAVEGTDNPVTIEITEAKEVTAVFTRKIYDLNVTIQGEGTVAEEVVVAPSQYEFETQVKLTANPAEGWEFANWSGAVEGTDNPVTIEITEAKEVTAVFTRKIYDLNVTIQGEGTVAEEVVVAPSQYEFETQVELTANPAEFYKFVAWSGYLETTDNPITVLVDQGISLTATFELKDTDGDGVTDDIDQCPNTPEGAVIDANGCQIPPVYLDENGVTVKARDFAEVGETWEIDGVEYTVVDLTLLREMIGNNADLNRVVTTKVTDMNELFLFQSSFSADLSSWDVSNVTRFRRMFGGTTVFESDLSFWDTSSATNMDRMFDGAKLFTSDLSNWNVSNVTNFSKMFSAAENFESDLNSWDVSNATDMSGMFAKTKFFNSNLNDWNTGNVLNMEFMFFEALAFNGNISTWNVANVKTMSTMFHRARDFNQDLNQWDVSSVVDMFRLFQDSGMTQVNLSSWNVSNVVNMSFMFASNQIQGFDIQNWNVSSVRDMSHMFENSSETFSGDLQSWDVRNVENMDFMFNGITYNNWNLDKWCVPLITQRPTTFNTGQDLIEPQWGTCPLEDDTDGDGVVDYFDQCPDTPNGVLIDENGCQIPPIYVAENGVTIKARDFAQIGDSWEINGNLFTIVDGTTLRQMVDNDEDVTKVVTSVISNISYLFYLKTNFNQDISTWDTSNIIDMAALFQGAESFNQDLSAWDTSNVTNMFGTFGGTKFNLNVGGWDVSKVENMEQIFAGSDIPNLDLSSWNTASVTNLRLAFNSETFNSDISNWNTSNVTNMNEVFQNASEFNQDISNWDVSNTTDMYRMFLGASAFNQDLSVWNTNLVTSCDEFSAGASSWTLAKPSLTNCNPN